MASELETLESRYRGYLPSRLSGFYLMNCNSVDYSYTNLPRTPQTDSLPRRRPSFNHSPPDSDSPTFTIPRVRLGGSESSSLGGTFPRRLHSLKENQPDLLPSPPRS